MPRLASEHGIAECAPHRCRHCGGLIVTRKCVKCFGPHLLVSTAGAKIQEYHARLNEPTAKERSAIESRAAEVRRQRLAAMGH